MRLVASLLVLIVVTAAAPAAAAPIEDGDCAPSARPRLIEVRTKPRVAGFRFRLAGRVYVTGERGRVRVASVTCADEDRALAPLTLTKKTGPNNEAMFDGWFGKPLLGRRAGDGIVWASFRQRSRVSFSFKNLSGTPVPRSSLGVLTAKGSTGAVVDLPPDQDRLWLDSSRVVRFSTGLVSKDILWSVQSVDKNGNNLVNRGGIRFQPRRTPAVLIPLLLYPLKLTVRDTILQRPVGDKVTITFPNGEATIAELDEDGHVDVGLLGRGTYLLRGDGPGVAIAFDQPVAMSRPQDAELGIVSLMDLALFGGFWLIVAVGLVAGGRHIHQRRLAREAATPAMDAGDQPPEQQSSVLTDAAAADPRPTDPASSPGSSVHVARGL